MNALQITDPRGDPDNPLTQGSPTWADAYTQTTDALGTWLAEQRAKSQQMGLWNDATGLPTGAGVVNAGQQYGNALLMGTTAPGVRAYHGSPHSFEQFDSSKIGTGEGAQAYGHGLYFAEREPVAERYLQTADWKYGGRKAQTVYDQLQNPSLERGLDNEGWSKLNAQRGFWEKVALGRSPRSIIDDVKANPDQYGEHEAAYALSLDPNKFKRTGGSMYEVNIGADPETFLHWDKPLSEQHPVVQQALQQAGYDLSHNPATAAYGRERTGGELLKASGDQAKVAQELQAAGIPGIRYLDQGSRGAGEGSHNYVVFDAKNLEILRKYGLAGLMAGGAATGAVSGDNQ